MTTILNSLATEEDIQNYKDWLKKKPTSRLYGFYRIVERDMKSEIKHYPNPELRLSLINEEITKRLN